LKKAFPQVELHIVQVGAEVEIEGAVKHTTPYKYSQEANSNLCPFDTCGHYEIKSWQVLRAWRGRRWGASSGRGRDCFAASVGWAKAAKGVAVSSVSDPPLPTLSAGAVVKNGGVRQRGQMRNVRRAPMKCPGRLCPPYDPAGEMARRFCKLHGKIFYIRDERQAENRSGKSKNSLLSSLFSGNSGIIVVRSTS
jgi:hypothetical protein